MPGEVEGGEVGGDMVYLCVCKTARWTIKKEDNKGSGRGVQLSAVQELQPGRKCAPV